MRSIQSAQSTLVSTYARTSRSMTAQPAVSTPKSEVIQTHGAQPASTATPAPVGHVQTDTFESNSVPNPVGGQTPSSTFQPADEIPNPVGGHSPTNTDGIQQQAIAQFQAATQKAEDKKKLAVEKLNKSLERFTAEVERSKNQPTQGTVYAAELVLKALAGVTDELARSEATEILADPRLAAHVGAALAKIQAKSPATFQSLPVEMTELVAAAPAAVAQAEEGAASAESTSKEEPSGSIWSRIGIAVSGLSAIASTIPMLAPIALFLKPIGLAIGIGGNAISGVVKGVKEMAKGAVSAVKKLFKGLF